MKNMGKRKGGKPMSYMDRFQRIIAPAYHANPNDRYTAWRYLEAHPIFNTLDGTSYFVMNLTADLQKVDEEINSDTEWWLEAGPIYLREDAPDSYWNAPGIGELADRPGVFWQVHDYRLDCGDASYDKAIIELAERVSDVYGDDRSKVYDSSPMA